MQFLRFSIINLAVALFAAVSAQAGDLNPPAGPISPTMKTLTEIEPRVIINATNTPGDADSLFKITQPGSYYLTGNVTGVSGKYGIKITAPHVTIDLNGFELTGVPGSLVGITDTGFTSTAFAATIRNGSLRNWGQSGMDLSATSPSVEHVRVSACGGNGFSLGLSGRADGCSATDNGDTGFALAFGAAVRNCVANSNTYYGYSSNGGTIDGCTAGFNGFAGYLAQATVISNCEADDNTVAGFYANGGANLVNCTAIFNGSSGTGYGIYLSGFGRATRCHVTSSSGDGFAISDDCVVTDCSSLGNSNRGFWLFAVSSRVEGCHAANNAIGYAIPGSGNLVVRNSARANTAANFSVPAPGAGCGTIINASATPVNNANSFANIEF